MMLRIEQGQDYVLLWVAPIVHRRKPKTYGINDYPVWSADEPNWSFQGDPKDRGASQAGIGGLDLPISSANDRESYDDVPRIMLSRMSIIA